MAKWLRETRRPGRTRGVKTLTNNPERGNNTFGGLKAVGRTQRNIRRLMKRDPQNAQGTPANEFPLQTVGVDNTSGASEGVTVMGHTESRAVNKGTSQSGRPKIIRDRSKNTSLKKR